MRKIMYRLIIKFLDFVIKKHIRENGEVTAVYESGKTASCEFCDPEDAQDYNDLIELRQSVIDRLVRLIEKDGYKTAHKRKAEKKARKIMRRGN